jgi:hypothetical protein
LGGGGARPRMAAACVDDEVPLDLLRARYADDDEEQEPVLLAAGGAAQVHHVVAEDPEEEDDYEDDDMDTDEDDLALEWADLDEGVSRRTGFWPRAACNLHPTSCARLR